MRDWSRGQTLGYYTIQPCLFNTRMPLHINDEDLCATGSNNSTQVSERPRSEFTMLSYTIYALDIAGLVRESIELRNALFHTRLKTTGEGTKALSALNQKYEKFVATLPTHFRLGSSVGLTSTGPLAAVPVQQWMLHQQLWSLFLRIHRSNLSSTDGRASCQLLAQNIISNHAQVQARCSVCGSLSIGDAQLFNAAAVLVIGLIFESKPGGAESSGSQLSRLMTRDKIREAIELLRARSDTTGSRFTPDSQPQRIKVSNQRGLVTLETMMELEENNRDIERTDGSKLLKRKVLDILQGLSQPIGVPTPEEPVCDSSDSLGSSMSLPPSVAFSPGNLDVLPILSNDPACNFWQSLDFTSEQAWDPNEFLFETTNWQSLVNSMPFTPHADMMLSVDRNAIPELDEMCEDL